MTLSEFRLRPFHLRNGVKPYRYQSSSAATTDRQPGYRYWPVFEMVSMARPASLPLPPDTNVRM
jgi:hypothetical protein